MNDEKFESLVNRLEKTAAAQPQRYRVMVILVAALGFCILGLVFGFVLIAAALAVGLAFLLVGHGGGALLLLAKLGKGLILLAIPAWTMAKSSITLLFSRFPPPQGREVTRAEAPRLFDRLDELRRRMQGPPVHKVLLSDEINAAIVQHPRFGLLGWERNYLILGLPLLQALGEEEALAVVAHEYGHLSGYHGRLGGFIYRFRAAWGRLQELSNQWTDWGSRLIARLFRWYAPYFNAYTFVLARQNEYQADRSAAEMVGRQHAANALMRVNIAAQFADGKFWPTIERRAGLEAEPLGSRSAFWQESLSTGLDPQLRREYLEVARKRQTDHLDTHPALRDRLAAIGASADEDAAQELQAVAVSAAQTWLGPSLAKLAAEFDADWRERVAERWRERHKHLQERQARLAELEARATLDADERWERIRIIDELRPEDDQLPSIEELLAIEPEHLAARFRRGSLLLDRGDAAGIGDLEAVMAADADAILPACENAWRFYQERDADKAKYYADRWRERSAHLEAVRSELASLTATATLAPADLPAKDMSAIADIVRRHGKHLSRAWVLRRVLKSDPGIHDHVLAFETSRFTLGDKGPAVVKRLLAQEFPVRLFVVHLGTEPFKRFRKQIKNLGVAPLAIR